MSIDLALKYLLDRHYPISPNDVKTIGVSIKQVAGGYNPVRQELWAAVYDAVWGYLTSTQYIPTQKMPMSAALGKAYIETADIAYEDGGGTLPLDDDTLSTAKTLMNEQLGYVDSLFDTLKQLRKDGDYDAINVAFQKANSYSSALDGFYNIIKMAGAGNKMLTWQLGNTEKHCDDCKNLDGQRHRASWYNSHGYTPRKPGSNTECGGYNCDCRLVDDDGNEFTI